MGFTGLSYWVNAPSNAVEWLRAKIVNNHSGQVRSRWNVQVRSYRCVLEPHELGLQIPTQNDSQPQPLPPPRNMATVVMNDAVFAMIEDPIVPLIESSAARTPEADVAMTDGTNPAASTSGGLLAPPSNDLIQRPHRRTTFLTIQPPESLDNLLQLLKAKWVPVRQSGAGAKAGTGPGAQVTIEGLVFAIGQDWVVRAGNIILSGGALRGMLLEAEYLPLAKAPRSVFVVDDTPRLLQEFLSSLLPKDDNAKTIIFPIPDDVWDDILFDTDMREQPVPTAEEVGDDIYMSAEKATPRPKRGDWTGIYRDGRSAVMLIGALRMEGIL